MGVLRATANSSIVCVFLLLGCKKSERSSDQPTAEPPKAEKRLEWSDDYQAALKQAKSTKRPVLLYFSGSDWCPRCKSAEERILGRPEWSNYVKESLVVVQIDFPRRKQLREELEARNAKLQRQFAVKDFPSFVLVDAGTEKPIAKLGVSPEDTAMTFIQRLADAKNGRTLETKKPVRLQSTQLHAASGEGERVDYQESGHEPGKWTQDFDAAVEAAQKTKRPILILFTGSDWCAACEHIKKEVLSKANWQRFARMNLVLLVMDFPRKKRLPEAVKTRNEVYSKKFRIAGFPSFLLFEPDGKTLINTVQQELSPRLFKIQIKRAMRLGKHRVAELAAQMGEDGRDYTRLMTELAAAIHKQNDLVEEGRRLYRIGGVTKEFREQMRKQKDIVDGLQSSTDFLEKRLFARGLDEASSGRYLKLYDELRTAEKAYSIWLDSGAARTPQGLEQMRSHQATIEIIKEAMADIENAHTIKHLNKRRAENFRKILKDLKAKKEYRDRWLASDPADTPTNTIIHKKMIEEIHLLEDRLDAIRETAEPVRRRP